jgi:hypothetical protein
LNHREITITTLNHDYTATEPRWQSTIDIFISRRRSNEFSKKEIAVTTRKVYREVDQQVYKVGQDSTEAAC